jgi:lysophospholipid acyltransferase
MSFQRYYVYWRLPSGPIATYGTYFVSAFWHGFYPGYYMFFIYAALLTETARVARRVLRPYFVEMDGKVEVCGNDK